MFKGNLYVTTDMNMVKNLMGTNRIVLLTEMDNQLVSLTNGVVGSILLPPYPALMAKLDGNINEFVNQYTFYLSQKEPSNFLAVIFRALLNGINILIYIKPDEYDMFFEVLAQYMSYNYGVIIGTPNNQFTFLPQFTDKICTLLYLFELLSVEELFTNYSPDGLFTDEVIMKLIQEVRPYVFDTSFDSYKVYFHNYKQIIKRNNNKFMESPIYRGV